MAHHPDALDLAATLVHGAAERYAIENPKPSAAAPEARERMVPLRGWCAETMAAFVGAMLATRIPATFVSGEFMGEHHCWALAGPDHELFDLTASQFLCFAARPIVRVTPDEPDGLLYVPHRLGAEAVRACLDGDDILRVMQICLRIGAPRQGTPR